MSIERSRAWQYLWIASGVALGMSPRASWGQDVPPYLASQGRIFDAQNQPITGTEDVTFSLYADYTPESELLWEETLTVALNHGYYSVLLGQLQPLPIEALDGSIRYLGLTIGGEQLEPRLPLHSVAYAIRAGVAGTAQRVVVPGLDGAPDITLDQNGLSMGEQTVIDGTGVWQGPSPAVAVGEGLTGDGSPDSPLAVVPPQLATVATSGDYFDLAGRPLTLADMGCGNDEVVKYDGGVSAWVCAPITEGNMTYSAGLGLTANGNEFAVDQTVIEGWAKGVCLDSEAELTALLDDNYRPASYVPAWSELTGIPAGFADGTDDDTVLDEAAVDAYTANNGYAKAGDLVDGNPATAPVGWSDLTGVPSGFADGTDQDTVLDEATVDAYADNNGYAEAAALADGDNTTTPVGWSDLTGVPSGFADGVDQDTVLDEATVDAYADNNGYAKAVDLAAVATSGSYNDLADRPPGLVTGAWGPLEHGSVFTPNDYIFMTMDFTYRNTNPAYFTSDGGTTITFHKPGYYRVDMRTITHNSAGNGNHVETWKNGARLHLSHARYQAATGWRKHATTVISEFNVGDTLQVRVFCDATTATYCYHSAGGSYTELSVTLMK